MTAQPLPKVICVMMATVDGKIGSGVPGVDVVEDYLDIYRKVDDSIAGDVSVPGNAWLCGRVTSELYFASGKDTPLDPASEPVPARRFHCKESIYTLLYDG